MQFPKLNFHKLSIIKNICKVVTMSGMNFNKSFCETEVSRVVYSIKVAGTLYIAQNCHCEILSEGQQLAVTIKVVMGVV